MNEIEEFVKKHVKFDFGRSLCRHCTHVYVESPTQMSMDDGLLSINDHLRDSHEHDDLYSMNIDPPNPRQDILDEASKCVNIDRTQNYGPPEQGFKNIAEIWSVILGTPITSAQVAQCMVGLKLARLIQSPGHKDSWVDIAGYAACGWEASQ